MKNNIIHLLAVPHQADVVSLFITLFCRWSSATDDIDLLSETDLICCCVLFILYEFILHEQLKGEGSVVIVKETKGNRECWMTSNDKGSIPGTNSRCPGATKSPDACLSKVYPYDAHSTYYISQCDCHFLQSSGALNVPMRKVSGWAATVMRHVFGH